MSTPQPAYLHLLQTGELQQRVAAGQQMLTRCLGCAWHCGVDRTAGRAGKCRTGARARVASYGPHLGEEDPLRGWRGSGTIFFSRCNLSCLYCQNYDISQYDAGLEMDAEELAAVMLLLQRQGCHNINLVSPSHVIPQILAALLAAAQNGLHLPLVFNSGGYDSPEALALLDGVIDIYMPDMKYADEAVGRRLSGIPNYPKINQSAVKEMHRQVGDLLLDTEGLAVRGLLVRHLVLPGGLAGTEKIAYFLASEISTHTYLNLMDQYHPAYWAYDHPQLKRSLTLPEFREALEMVHRAGLKRLDQRRSV